MKPPWRVVLVKEVRENLRDRRALLSALLYGPLIGPVLFALLMSFVIGEQQERLEQPLTLAVAGQDHAPNLVAFLRQQGVIVEAAPADMEGAIRSQARDVILSIRADYGDAWRAGTPARVDLLVDRSRQSAQIALQRVSDLLNQYAGTIASLRLRVRGINPEIVQPIRAVQLDLSTPKSRGALMMAMLPYFLILSAFVGGMYLAIDTTAGERERLSLEALLLNPVAVSHIMAGKLLATSAFAVASLAMCVLAFTVTLGFVPVAQLGYDLQVSPVTALWMLAVVAPIALLAAASQTLLASFARTFREAQTYLQVLIIIPAVPTVMLALTPAAPDSWMRFTPLFSQSLLIDRLARGDALAALDLALSAVPTLAVGLALAWLAARLYGRERMLLGSG